MGIHLAFVSQRVAELWFLCAKRFVDDAKSLRPSQLSTLHGVNHQNERNQWMPPVLRPTTGQLFFWNNHSRMYGYPSIEDFAAEVRKALQKKDP